MLIIKLLLLSVFLISCYNNAKQAIIIDKSINLPHVKKPPQRIKISKIPRPATADKKIPVQAEIIKKFSKKHLGITFNTKIGQSVRAFDGGVVVYSGNKMKSHGEMIIIKHPLGFYSSYIHNKTRKVFEGDNVKKGQEIAITGKNPFYFELKKFSSPIDPIPYLK